MDTRIDEISEGIFRVSTHTDEIPGGFTFNQFLVLGEEPFLFHCGLKASFVDVAGAVASVCPLSELRWISFGHWEADESGAMNEWLGAAPSAEVAVGSLGAMISGGDQARRPPRTLANGEVLDVGGKRLRWIDTPHVPHGWDAGVVYEETTRTLLCGDLLSHTGAVRPLTEGDVLGPALAAEDMFQSTALTPRTAPTIRELGDLEPHTLGIMHGSAYSGDCRSTLWGLADELERRMFAALPPTR